jgi:hypothetical protein
MTTTNDPQQQPALGTCARCDQPATVAITDAPGNVRCDVHAAAIFQPYSVQQQPPPSARPNNPRMICDCGECVGDRPAPSRGATAGGIERPPPSASEDELDERYQRFLAGLSPDNLAEWKRCVDLFNEKFGAELAAEGIRGGIDLLPEGESRELD